MSERAAIREQLEKAWDGEERWEGDFVRPSYEARERMIDEIVAERKPNSVARNKSAGGVDRRNAMA